LPSDEKSKDKTLNMFFSGLFMNSQLIFRNPFFNQFYIFDNVLLNISLTYTFKFSIILLEMVEILKSLRRSLAD